MKTKMMGAIAVLAATGFVASAHADTSTFQQGVSGYTGSVDTQLSRNSGKQENNYGAQDAILAQGPESDPISQGLIKFDDIFGAGLGQVPVGQTITSATLSLYYYNTLIPGGTARRISAHAILIDVPNYGNKDDSAASVGEVSWKFREQAVTGWGTLGTGNVGPVSGEDFDAIAEGSVIFNPNADLNSFLNIDITSLVQDWYDGTLPNYGVAIRPSDSAAELFRTSEVADSSLRPILTINYIPEPASLALLGLAGGLMLCKRHRRAD